MNLMILNFLNKTLFTTFSYMYFCDIFYVFPFYFRSCKIRLRQVDILMFGLCVTSLHYLVISWSIIIYISLHRFECAGDLVRIYYLFTFNILIISLLHRLEYFNSFYWNVIDMKEFTLFIANRWQWKERKYRTSIFYLSNIRNLSNQIINMI